MKKLLGLLLFAFAPSLFGAVTFRTKVTQNHNALDASSATVSVTTQSGDFLVVSISYALNVAVDPTSSSVTFNGDALTRRAFHVEAFSFLAVELWTLKNPDIGTFNLVATFAQANTAYSITAMMYTNVNDFVLGMGGEGGVGFGGQIQITPAGNLNDTDIVLGTAYSFDNCIYTTITTGGEVERDANANSFDTNKSTLIADKPGNNGATTLIFQNDNGGTCNYQYAAITLNEDSGPTATPTPTLTFTPTVTNTPTNTFTPTKTFTPTNTFTPSPTFTASKTPTVTPTFTPQPPITRTPVPASMCFTLENSTSGAGRTCQTAGFPFSTIELYSASGSTATIVIEIRVDPASPWVVFDTITDPPAVSSPPTMLVELPRVQAVRARIVSLTSGSIYALIARYYQPQPN